MFRNFESETLMSLASSVPESNLILSGIGLFIVPFNRGDGKKLLFLNDVLLSKYAPNCVSLKYDLCPDGSSDQSGEQS